MLINVKMPTIGNCWHFYIMSSKILYAAEHEKSFINSGPGPYYGFSSTDEPKIP